MVKRFQNRIAEGRMTLPVMSVIAAAIWLVSGLVQRQLWLPAACFAITAFLLVELNNANSLIRIYSRTVSSAFMVMMCSSVYLLPSLKGGVIDVCAVSFYILFLHSFQNNDASGRVFYAFFFVGLASVLFVQMLFYVPLLLVMLSTNMTAMGWRTLSASFLGLLLPYWFVAGYYALVGDFTIFTEHFLSIAEFGSVADLSGINAYQFATFAFVVTCSIIGIVHFLRNSNMDKIRTRMIFEMFITMNIATILFIILQPIHFDILIRIAIINTSPLIAHFVSLTHTRLTNILTILLLIVAVSIPLITFFFSLWTPLLTF
ncbi:hypothetical protein [Prevotella sp. OH937_COT-195]|uniref:hypothetical protein n=1 Tax=Prevotella sp. OH937_COT-195 TaxID=2491051 RepID=UPI000F654BCF|nr:hypothetical protein [Prevotella sp. OH937_COT-195]RRD01899.1 hypothetical protein EII32_05590 [Prevotella sp. OH937_COT-195]